MVDLARSEANIPIIPNELDTYPWLLNVSNGTIDLRTGKLLPHDPAHLMTKLVDVNFDPKAKCPIWESFLDRHAGSGVEKGRNRGATGY